MDLFLRRVIGLGKAKISRVAQHTWERKLREGESERNSDLLLAERERLTPGGCFFHAGHTANRRGQVLFLVLFLLFAPGRDRKEPGREAERGGGRGVCLPDSRGQDRTWPNMGGHRRLRQRHTAAAAQIPSSPASTPKLLSQRVYSALLALDV